MLKKNSFISVIVLLLVLVLVFLLAYPLISALPFFKEIPIDNWLSLNWEPEEGSYGFSTALFGSFFLVILALPLALLMGWLVSLQLVDNRKIWINPVSVAILEVWISLPSVIIGVWAMSQLVPIVREISGTGFSMLTAAIGLTIFIMPTCTLLFYRSYLAHQDQYGGLENSFEMSVLARSELFIRSQATSVIGTINYTFCRVFGETMIVLMLSGNSLQIPHSPFEGIRTLTATIALEMAYSTGMHETSLFALATVAIMVILVVLLVQYKRLINA